MVRSTTLMPTKPTSLATNSHRTVATRTYALNLMALTVDVIFDQFINFLDDTPFIVPDDDVFSLARGILVATQVA